MAWTTPLYRQHSRHWRTNRYVYPVISRRSKGLSIGVNLNPDKVCNFDCVYCSVDRTVPPSIRQVDLDLLRVELDEMLGLGANGQLFHEPPFDQAPANLRRLNDVAFSGDGEPTGAPCFEDAARLAVELLGIRGLRDVRIIVITNATLLERPAVARTLEMLDRHNGEIWAKLDAGTDEYYQQVDRTSIPLERVLDNILRAGRKRPLSIQSMFARLHDRPPDEQEIGAYVQRLRSLREGGCQIKAVQIYTVARQPAEHYVQPMEADELASIGAHVTEAGFAAEVYPG